MSTLPENDRLSGPFVAIADQVEFDADFPLIDAPGDPSGTCVVMRRIRAGVTTDLVLGAFTVAETAENGFTLALVTPALAGDVYWIAGLQRQKRLRAHPSGGAVRTPTLEDDAREAAARGQEAARDLSRALAVPFGETAPALQPLAERSSRLAAFDAGGALIGERALLVFDAQVTAAIAAGSGAQTALAQILAALAGPGSGMATGAAFVGLPGGGNLAGALAGTLYTSQFPTFAAAVAVWAVAGGTLVVNQDLTETVNINVGLVADKTYRLTCDRPRTITYAGLDVATYMKLTGAARAPLIIDSGLTLDCQNKAATGLHVDYISVTGSDRRDARIGMSATNCKLKTYSSGGANGVAINGGFRKLTVAGFRIGPVSRLAGTGNAGSWGCTGLIYNGHSVTTANALEIVIEDFVIDTVTTEDAAGTSAYSDCDGVLLFTWANGADAGVQKPPIIRNGRVREAVGRAIKTYCPGAPGTLTENLIIERSLQGVNGGSVDVAHQHGGGTMRGLTFLYSGNAHVTPTKPMGFALGSIMDPGPGLVENIQLYDATAAAKKCLVQLNYNQNDVTPRAYTIRNIKDRGSCEYIFTPAAMGSVQPLDVHLEQVDVTLSQGCAQTDDDMYYLRVTARQLRNRGASVPALRTLADAMKSLRWGDFEAVGPIVGMARYVGLWRGNAAFTNGFRGIGGGVEASPTFGTSEVAGRVVLPVVSLAAGATWNGPAVGLYANNGGDFSLRVMLLSSLDGYGEAITPHDGTGWTSIKAPPSPLVFVNGGASTGTGTNLEVWKDAATQAVRVTNRTAATVWFQPIFNP